MISRCLTISVLGIDPIDVQVESHMIPGYPSFGIVGLADKVVSESRDRVRSALSFLTIDIPPKRILVNLSPASILKEGSHYDLPVALCILADLDIIPRKSLKDKVFVGELGLDGSIKKTSKTLIAGQHCKNNNLHLICSEENLQDCSVIKELKFNTFDNLLSLIAYLKQENHDDHINISKGLSLDDFDDSENFKVKFEDIIGCKTAKRAALISLCGSHNFLMIGHPGTGKSMIASAMHGCLPKLNDNEIVEMEIIKSISKNYKNTKMSNLRPFRSPHHSSSAASIIGGGKPIRPGEVTMSHNGILFLDEFPEFQSQVLESLREPLETGIIHISRADERVSYPCNFQLVAAMNHCKCGYIDIPQKQCTRAPICKMEYMTKISGPILDRIDIFTYMNYQDNSVDSLNSLKENKYTSENILSIVKKTRDFQIKRTFSDGGILNANLTRDQVLKYCQFENDECSRILNNAVKKYHLSIRSYVKIMKIARTIADIDESKNITSSHILEAIGYKAFNY